MNSYTDSDWLCSVTTVIVLRASRWIYRRRRTEKYISYYFVSLTGTQNWLNTHSTVFTAMCASVLTASITLLFFFLYPVTEREKALRQEREQKELTIIWLRVSSTCCVNKGFLVKKILSSTFKSVDDEYIQCDVVYINVLVDSSYPRTASLLISARFVVNTIFVHYFRYCTIVVTTRCRSQYYN